MHLVQPKIINFSGNSKCNGGSVEYFPEKMKSPKNPSNINKYIPNSPVNIINDARITVEEADKIHLNFSI